MTRTSTLKAQTRELQKRLDEHYATKPTNPKDAMGTNKLPLHLWPTTATALGCVAFAEGMLKYGRTNWREAGVRASIYVDAAKRHLDAKAAGKLHDDRAYNGVGYRALVEQLTPIVAQLREQHADKTPRHYTIADGAQDGAA